MKIKEIIYKSLIIILILSFCLCNMNFIYAAEIIGGDETLPAPDPEDPPSTPSTPPGPGPSPEPQPPPEPPKPSISGSVWEDNKSYTDEYGVLKGNGIFDSGENLIDGVSVKLYQVDISAGTGTIKNETVTDSNGSYTFNEVDPGDYMITFTYGNDKYNGLDYKSTYTPNDNNLRDNAYYAVDSQERRLDLMMLASNIDYESMSNILNNDISMTASTGCFSLTENDTTCNLAVEERPKSSVKISKNVSHLIITLSDGKTLIDWKPNASVDHLMVIPNASLTAIMDDELTHGATIKITYDITITNTSENDHLANYFKVPFIGSLVGNSNYSKWLNLLNPNNNSSLSLQDFFYTKYDIYDYLDNNLVFDENNNSDNWKFENSTNLIPHSPDMNISDKTILSNSIFLRPGESKTLSISTSKLMAIADNDLLTYNNYVEMVKYSSGLGRIMKDIIPGNLNIFSDEPIKEFDEAKAETVNRVPPFGKDLSYYTTIVGIIVLAIEIAILSVLKFRINNLRSKYISRIRK